MYRYDQFDQNIVDQRVAQFRDQTRRYLAGELSESEFLPIRLQNGLYIQRHAPMLRVSIPYGHLSSRQLRKLAYIGRRYDKGYGHFSTRQNIQFNWPRLEEVPDILAELAQVEMHAIQTSGNCIRNITSDHFAGVAGDEVVDPRAYCELVRQWSTFNPEFAFLPRKFKIAISGSEVDRAATQVHDIGLHAFRDDEGEVRFRVLVGGGLGRTPIIGQVIREALDPAELLNYLESILRVYNRYGRRDNKYKARVKILVKELGIARFRDEVESDYKAIEGQSQVPSEEIARLASFFEPPAYARLQGEDARYRETRADNRAFDNWCKRNVAAHKMPGYAIVTLSLKRTGVPPGDVTSDQMDAIANLADHYSFGEIRVSHEQNLVFAHVREAALLALWSELKGLKLATPNIGLLTDIICCPGGDYCSLANAKSIPIAEAIQRRFDDLDYLHDLGEIDLNISGCMNACGHHHVGNIGILGVDKNGSEWYQVSIGGAQGAATALGKVIGPSFAAHEMPDVIQRLVDVYVDLREADETFAQCVHRTGLDPFKERVYAEAH